MLLANTYVEVANFLELVEKISNEDSLKLNRIIYLITAIDRTKTLSPTFKLAPGIYRKNDTIYLDF